MGFRHTMRRWFSAEQDAAAEPFADRPGDAAGPDDGQPSWARGLRPGDRVGATSVDADRTDSTSPTGSSGTVGAAPPEAAPPDAAPADAEEPPLPSPDEVAARVAARAAHRGDDVPDPHGGGLVMGQGDHRTAPVELPAFYSPPTLPVPVTVTHEPLPRVEGYDRAKVREAWDMVSDRADRLVRDFYAELFLRLPEAPTMFPSSMVRQRDEFGRALVQWLVTDDPDSLSAHLDQLGADHRKFAVEPRHYDVAGAAMISAWKRLAGPEWTDGHEDALVGSYTRLASIMISGAMRRQHEPASWGAQVIEHRRVHGNFAVLRLQPDEPYSYKPGQYLTLELPSHRRQWRQMSIASAPRADNTIDLHVRAVGAAGVSAALVMHTRQGDRLRLGAPRGNDLVVEPGTVPNGVLCVASGTGAAPITAVVESMLHWREPVPLWAFVGGRTREDIYSVDLLGQLVRSGENWRRAQVHGVLSDDADYDGYRGRVEEVVPALHDWARLGVDVLVSGPNSMISSTVTALSAAGVPLHKIHFDQYDTED